MSMALELIVFILIVAVIATMVIARVEGMVMV